MTCNYECFRCPYEDCIRALKDENPEVHKRYYETHKAERLAYQKAYNESHKANRHEQSKRRWANMTEEQREKERERQREYYRRRKNAITQ